MLAKLLERETATGERREIAITKDEFLIGRGIDCDLRLRTSNVSRHHCLLRFRADETTLQDLGSANGTFVNGQRVRSQTALVHGDEISLGDFHCVLEMTGQSGVDWGPAAGADQGSPTYRIKDFKKQLQKEPDKKDEGHPPGETGGRTLDKS